jgi:hypothetical protein
VPGFVPSVKGSSIVGGEPLSWCRRVHILLNGGSDRRRAWWLVAEGRGRGLRLRGNVDRLKMKGWQCESTAQVVPSYVDHTVVRVALYPSSDTPLPPESMAIGKAARWISFATPQQTPSSSSVANDTDHSTHSIADEKQFGLENVRYRLLPFQQKSRSL